MITAIAQKITALILVLILFSHNINTLVIVGDFVINQDFIAKTLCIQKDAQKGCNGKCQLRKELSDTNSSSKSDNPIQENKRMALDLFCISNINTVTTASLPIYVNKVNSISISPRIFKMFLEIDTPPPKFS